MTIAALTIGALLVISTDLRAQGKGIGLNRGLSAAAKGSSSTGLTKAMGKSANAGNGLLRSGSGFGRTGGGLNGSGAADTGSPVVSVPDAADAVSGTTQALDNQQSILTKRLQQADHLRAVSAANGNEHLLETADRMQANATTNFQRQQQRLNATMTDPSTGSTTTPSASSITTDTPTAPLATAPQPRIRRGLWIRSR
jgi:hypothetical protein